jgi:homoserine kinase type II
VTDTPSQSNPSIAVSSARSGVSSARDGRGERDRFAVDELAIVLSHYDVGIIDSIQDFPRGSRRAPKLLLRTEKGPMLLKRRARGKDDPFKVAFCHQLQLFLADQQFPLPHLIGTRKENNSMLQWRGGIYELFEYIKGTGYDSSLEATQDSGKTLGLFHKLLVDFESEYEPATGSYHDAKAVQGALSQIPRTLEKIDSRVAEEADRVSAVSRFLEESYDLSAARVNATGLPDWPAQIVHSDWHPGNMLFRGSRVVAVIDYDAARLNQRIIDAANGALQFSIVGGAEDTSKWPDYLDVSRYKRFLIGYDRVNQLTRAELRCVPWLMIEALIAEAAIPIAATGSFARMDGFDFLLMIERKVRWLRDHADTLATVLDS